MKPLTHYGALHIRDYGILLEPSQTFLSPTKYVLARLLLEDKEDLEKKFTKFTTDFSAQTWEQFQSGLNQRGDLHLLEQNAQDLFSDVKALGANLTAQIHSNPQKGPYQIRRAKEDRFCSCPDRFWGETKSKKVQCVHLSALELALYKDEKSRLSVENNLTGLFPSQRPSIELPFPFLAQKKDENLYLSSLFKYGLQRHSHLEMNKSLLDDPQIYAPKLRGLLERGKASFAAMRQQKVAVPQDDREAKAYSRAVDTLDRQVAYQLRGRGYTFEGYSLEFKGTEYECIAKRYKRGKEVMALTFSDKFPPLLLQKQLQDFHVDIFFQGNTRITKNALLNPQYISNQIDDTTRLPCAQKVIIPGLKEESVLKIPKVLQGEYKKFEQSF